MTHLEYKKYSEYPHTAFPENIDDAEYKVSESGETTTDTYAEPYMSDVDADTLGAMNQYNAEFLNGNFDQCMKILDTPYGDNNKKLKYSMFNADKFNWVRDAILSIQKFFLNDVIDYVNSVIDSDLHIQTKKIDTGKGESNACTYSARYINHTLDDEYYATLNKDDWAQISGGGFSLKTTATTPSAKDEYNKEIGNATIDDADYTCYPSLSENMKPADVKAYNKAFAYMYDATTNGDGTVTFYAWKKPATTITVFLKHV